jgi:hypothetical protein
MAFPTTGILDTFDRANDSTPPPGANWSTVYNGHDIITNQLRGHTNADANVSAWVAATYGPSIEAYITATAASPNFTLYMLNSGLEHGYSVSVEDGTSIKIYRQVSFGTTEVQLGATVSVTFGSGDGLGMYYDAAADTIHVYMNDSGGGWSEVTTRSDSSYTDMNSLAFFSFSNVITFNDFGGGTFVADTPKSFLHPNPVRRIQHILIR